MTDDTQQPEDANLMAAAGRLAGEAVSQHRDAMMEQYLAVASGLMGERRKLTPLEELNLAKADKLRLKARKLKRRAHKLHKKADRLEPKSLYPDSPLSKLLDNNRLAPGVGTTRIIPPYHSLTSHLFKPLDPTLHEEDEEDGA